MNELSIVQHYCLSQYFPNTFPIPFDRRLHFLILSTRFKLKPIGAHCPLEVPGGSTDGSIRDAIRSTFSLAAWFAILSLNWEKKKSKQTLCLQVASHCGQNAETVPRSINQTRGQCLRDVKMAITQNDCHRLAVCLSAYPTIDQVKKPLKWSLF